MIMGGNHPLGNYPTDHNSTKFVIYDDTKIHNIPFNKSLSKLVCSMTLNNPSTRPTVDSSFVQFLKILKEYFEINLFNKLESFEVLEDNEGALFMVIFPRINLFLQQLGWTPQQIIKWNTLLFFKASFQGNIEIVKYLIEKGSNINQGRTNGTTPLYIASQNSHIEIVKYLIEKGSNIN